MATFSYSLLSFTRLLSHFIRLFIRPIQSFAYQLIHSFFLYYSLTHSFHSSIHSFTHSHLYSIILGTTRYAVTNSHFPTPTLYKKPQPSHRWYGRTLSCWALLRRPAKMAQNLVLLLLLYTDRLVCIFFLIYGFLFVVAFYVWLPAICENSGNGELRN